MKDDPTARWEAMVDDVVGNLDEWAGRALASILPRPPGADPLSPEEAHDRWLALRGDTEKLRAILDQRAQSLGPVRAALEMLLWDKKHRAIEEGRHNGNKESGQQGPTDRYTAPEEGAETDNLQEGGAAR